MPDLHDLASYVALVREKAVRRRLVIALDAIAKRAGDAAEANDALLASARHALDGCDDGPDEEFLTPLEILERAGGLAGHLEAFRRSGVPLPYPALQRCVGGLFPGDLAILAGTTGGGKTAFALSIAHHLAQMGEGVVIFSMEMSRAAILNRICALHGQWNSKWVKHEMEDWQRDRVARSYADVSEMPIYVRDASGNTVYGLIGACRRLMAKRSISLVVVDYLQLMTGEGRDRVHQVGSVARGLKNAAMDLERPVLALSQFSRPPKGAEGRAPALTDLKESSEIEQAANLVLLLHGEARYDVRPDEPLPWDCMIAKQRDGISGVKIPYLWRKDCGLFTEVER
jgi:replicative DNA helicase